MNLELKPFAYLTVEEVQEYLGIPDAKKQESRNKIIRLINTACKRVENYIDGPVIARQYVEFRDGNKSNCLSPRYMPVKEIVEIKIDFNRAFDIATALTANNYVLRGNPTLEQQIKEPTTQLDATTLYEVDGTDIVIRDDNNTAVFGRLFSGSVIQSIKVTYKAGLALNIEDVPSDLQYATLLIVDHLYTAAANRDITINSKSNSAGSGASYSKTLGWPQEAVDILSDYKDYSFGTADVPQKNTFSL